jgi:hypothetical protein
MEDARLMPAAGMGIGEAIISQLRHVDHDGSKWLHYLIGVLGGWSDIEANNTETDTDLRRTR